MVALGMLGWRAALGIVGSVVRVWGTVGMGCRFSVAAHAESGDVLLFADPTSWVSVRTRLGQHLTRPESCDYSVHLRSSTRSLPNHR